MLNQQPSFDPRHQIIEIHAIVIPPKNKPKKKGPKKKGSTKKAPTRK